MAGETSQPSWTAALEALWYADPAPVKTYGSVAFRSHCVPAPSGCMARPVSRNVVPLKLSLNRGAGAIVSVRTSSISQYHW